MAFGYNIDQRKINKRNHIVNLFREHDTLSKAKARSYSGYSMDTVISIFASLIEDNLILPVSGQQKPQGRKAKFYSLNREREIYLGVTFNQQGIYSSIVSFSHQVMGNFYTGLDLGINRTGFMLAFEKHLRRTIDSTGASGNIAAIGCSIPGDINLSTGVLNAYALMPFLRNINFKKSVRKIASGIPVTVDHNVHSMASFLLLDSPFIVNFDKTIFVSARSATANGLICNGNIIVGHGEMGHVKVSDEAVECTCGRYGCLDSYFSYRGFIGLLSASTKSIKNGPSSLTGKNEKLDQLALLYKSGDSKIKNELDKRLDYFINALLDLINLTAPDLVLLTGELFKVFGDPPEIIVQRIKNRLAGFSLFSHYHNLEIQYKDLETRVISAGICFQMIRDKWEYHEE